MSGRFSIDGKRDIHCYLGLLALFFVGLYLRWPLPAPEWQHVDERAFILHPLGFWSGDLNPHKQPRFAVCGV